MAGGQAAIAPLPALWSRAGRDAHWDGAASRFLKNGLDQAIPIPEGLWKMKKRHA